MDYCNYVYWRVFHNNVSIKKKKRILVTFSIFLLSIRLGASLPILEVIGASLPILKVIGDNFASYAVEYSSSHSLFV